MRGIQSLNAEDITLSPRRQALKGTSLPRNRFERNAAIVSAKEIINENDGTRKRFE